MRRNTAWRRSLAIGGLLLLLPAVPTGATARQADDCDSLVGAGVPPPGFEERCVAWENPASTGGNAIPGHLAASADGEWIFTGGLGGVFAHRTPNTAAVWKARPTGLPGESKTVGDLVDVEVDRTATRVFVMNDDAPPGAPHDTDTLLTAYDAQTGSLLWADRFALPGIEESDRIYSLDRGATIVVSPDGQRVYAIAGTHLVDRIQGADVTREDVAVLAYDAASGGLLWWKRFGGKFIIEHAKWGQMSSDGSVLYIGGEQDRCAPCPTDYMLLAMRVQDRDPAGEGTILWDRYYDGIGGNEELNGMDVAPDDSRIYLSGSSDGTYGSDKEWFTVAASTEDGARLWSRRYEGGSYPMDVVSYDSASHEARGVVASPLGNLVFVAGYIAGLTLPGGGQGATIAYDAASGEVRWVADFRLPPLGEDTNHLPTKLGWGIRRHAGVATSRDGSAVYVIGGGHTLSYRASDGALRWVSRTPGLEVVVPGSGDLIVTRDHTRVRIFEEAA